MDENYAETIAGLAAAGLDPQFTSDKGRVPYVALPQNFSVHSLEKHLPQPTRTRGNRVFISLESFNRYVSTFKKSDTRIEVRAGGSARAIIDANGPDNPQWEEHSADFVLTFSDQWRAWSGKDKVGFGQRQFAEFVEDNLADFFAPKGGDMLDIARTLQAEQNSQFNSAIRLDNGDVQFGYVKTTVGKAGQKGELEIPSQFTIRVPVLENENPREIPVRLRYDLQDGKLTLTYEIIRKDALLQEVRRSIYAIIANETGITPFLVP